MNSRSWRFESKMSLQDIVDIIIAIGQINFIGVELIVVFSGHNDKPKSKASFITSSWLYVFCTCFALLGLWYTFGTALCNATLHMIICIQKWRKSAVQRQK